MIDVSNLTYDYPDKRVLHNISFSIDDGSVTALVGPNGAGKTTLMRCIAALDEPVAGNIYVANIDVEQQPRLIHSRIGYLSDFFGLYDELTIKQCLLFAAAIRNIDANIIEQHVTWVADLLELHERLDQKAGALSRGWRQRVAIAQAIIHKPLLLLLDEPASGLDPAARIMLSHLFKTLKNTGMTILVSSHILAELEDYCTDMLVLKEGKIIEHRKTTATTESTTIYIEVLEKIEEIVPFIKAMPRIHDVKITDNTICIHFIGNSIDKAELLKSLVVQGFSVVSFREHQKTLQDIYMAISK